MDKKPLWSLVVVLIALGVPVVLVGCGNGQATPTPTQTSNPSREAAGPKASSAAAPAASPPSPSSTKYELVGTGDNVGTYRVETVTLQTPADIFRVAGRVAVLPATPEGRALLITNYLEPFCYPPIAGPELCKALPEELRKKFGLRFGTWWIGDYTVRSSDEIWFWDQKRLKVPPGQGYTSYLGTDLYVLVEGKPQSDVPTILKFEDLNVVFGAAVRLSELVLHLPADGKPAYWVLYPSASK